MLGKPGRKRTPSHASYGLPAGKVPRQAPGMPLLRGAAASRTQALAAFHCLVAGSNQGSNNEVQILPQPPQTSPDLKPALGSECSAHGTDKHSAAAQPACAPALALAAQSNIPQQKQLQQQRSDPVPEHVPAFPVSLAHASERLPSLFDGLESVAYQISQHNGSYLYQIHEQITQGNQLLQSCLACLPALPAGGAAGPAGLNQKLGSVPFLLHHGCVCCWGVCCAILARHEQEASAAAEALPFHDAARRMWVAFLERSDERMEDFEPDVLISVLTPLAQAGRAWLSAGRLEPAEWPYQQLREQLVALEALGTDVCQSLEARCAAQLLQFYALQGSMVLAGRAGHQALWSNLVARMQRLLDSCLMPPLDTATLCQELADTLATQAGGTPTTAAGGRPCIGGRSAAELLRCAEGLIAHSLRLVEQLPELGPDEALTMREDGLGDDLTVWAGKLHEALVEVRLRASQAELDGGDFAAALESAQALLQALGGGDGSRAAGPASARVIKVMTYAFLALGRQAEAAVALCGWLGGGGCPDVQACREALRAFAAGCNLRMPGGVEQLCGVVAAASRAFPGRHDPAMAVVENLLGGQPPSTASSAADDAVLQVLVDDDVADSIKKIPGTRELCHSLLYSRGRSLHKNRHSNAARAMLACALFYSPPGAAHARAARLLAACCAALGERGAALDHLTNASNHEPPGAAPAAEKLLELRVLLMLQKAAAEDARARVQQTQAEGEEAPGSRGGTSCGARQPQPKAGRRDGGEEEDGAEDSEAQLLWRRICKAADALPLTCSIHGVDVMRVAYDECCAAEAWAASWQVLAAWRSSLTAAAPDGEAGGTAKAIQPAAAMAVLGRTLFFLREHDHGEGAPAQSCQHMPTHTQIMSEANQVFGLCSASLVAAAAARTSGTAQGEGTAADPQDVLEAAGSHDPSVVLLAQASEAGRAAMEVGLAELRAGTPSTAAEILQASADMHEAAAFLAKRAAGGGASHPDIAAKVSDYLREAQAARLGALRILAAVLAQAHDAAPGDSSLLKRMRAAVRRLRQGARGKDQSGGGGQPGAAALEAAQFHQKTSSRRDGSAAGEQLLASKLELLLAVHQGSKSKQRRLLSELVQREGLRPEDLLQAAVACLAPRPWKSEPSAMLALGFALRLAAEAPDRPPCVVRVAADAAQRLLRMASSVSVRVRVFDRIVDVLQQQSTAVEQAGASGGVQKHAAAVAVVAAEGGAAAIVNDDEPGSSCMPTENQSESHVAPAHADPAFPRQQLLWLVACCYNWYLEARRDGQKESADAYYACWQRMTPFTSGSDGCCGVKGGGDGCDACGLAEAGDTGLPSHMLSSCSAQEDGEPLGAQALPLRPRNKGFLAHARRRALAAAGPRVQPRQNCDVEGEPAGVAAAAAVAAAADDSHHPCGTEEQRMCGKDDDDDDGPLQVWDGQEGDQQQQEWRRRQDDREARHADDRQQQGATLGSEGAAVQQQHCTFRQSQLTPEQEVWLAASLDPSSGGRVQCGSGSDDEAAAASEGCATEGDEDEQVHSTKILTDQQSQQQQQAIEQGKEGEEQHKSEGDEEEGGGDEQQQQKQMQEEEEQKAEDGKADGEECQNLQGKA